MPPGHFTCERDGNTLAFARARRRYNIRTHAIIQVSGETRRKCTDSAVISKTLAMKSGTRRCIFHDKHDKAHSISTSSNNGRRERKSTPGKM